MNEEGKGEGGGGQRQREGGKGWVRGAFSEESFKATSPATSLQSRKPMP